MNLLLDTNVFIDYLGRKSPFFEPAQKLVMAAYFGDVALWVPSQSVVDAFYVLRKYVDSTRLQEMLVRALGLIRPVSLTAEDLLRAGRLSWFDMEDCLISLAADKIKADYLITRDARGFERSSVPSISPSEWGSLMLREKSLTYEEVDF